MKYHISNFTKNLKKEVVKIFRKLLVKMYRGRFCVMTTSFVRELET